VGIVYEPEFIQGFRLIVDYYSIEIDGAIDALSAERVAEACVDLGSTANQFCPLITRAPEGFITFHQSGQVNLGAFEVSGVDFGLEHGFSVGDMGSVRLGLSGTHLLDFDEFQDPIDSSVVVSRKGEFGSPELILNANATWNMNDLTLGWTGRFEESQLLNTITNQQVAGNPLFVDPSQTGDSWVHNFNFSYDFTESLNVNGGVNNAFDQLPYLGSLSRPAGPRGRFGFLAVNYRI
jgi:outer membrane receptor protein involved in Fe transport